MIIELSKSNFDRRETISVKREGASKIEIWTRTGDYGTAVDITPPHARQLARELVRLADEIEEIR